MDSFDMTENQDRLNEQRDIALGALLTGEKIPIKPASTLPPLPRKLRYQPDIVELRLIQATDLSYGRPTMSNEEIEKYAADLEQKKCEYYASIGIDYDETLKRDAEARAAYFEARERLKNVVRSI